MRAVVGGVLVGLLATPAVAQDDAVKKLTKEMEGKYKLVGLELDGKKQDPKLFGEEFTVRDGKLIAVRGGKEDPITFTIDPSQKPPHIDFEEKKPDGTVRKTYGIFKYDNGELTVCVADTTDPAKRPKEFKAPDTDTLLMVLKKTEK